MQGHVSLGFCVASLCAAVMVVVVVCAVLGCCGVLGLRSGKCLWLIAPCGWVVLWLWRDEGGRDVKFCMRVSCMICSRILVLLKAVRESHVGVGMTKAK